MDIFSVLIILVVFVIVLLVIIRPFYKPQTLHTSQSIQATDQSKKAYQQILNQIHELENEFADGKISADDYTSTRENLMLQAAQKLQSTLQTKTK
jgi:hypothetical protein